MNKKRCIAIYTGSRSEYGLLFPVIQAVNNQKRLQLKLLVSGSHLDSTFGDSCAEIARDGFDIHEKIPLPLVETNPSATSVVIGHGIVKIAEALARLNPSILLIYGDRFESFAAAIAATQMNIPTAHLEGGDLTDGGALDDSVRHAMTKLSHLHFTTNKEAFDRVLRLGEEPWRVFNVGLPVIDLIRSGNFAPEQALIAEFRLNPRQPLLLFTQHSVTTEPDQAVEQVTPSLDALQRLASEGYQVMLSYPNADVGGLHILDLFKSFMANSPKNFFLVPNLGRFRYHGLLQLAGNGPAGGACVGNSSSGIKEALAFGCPTVNIGSRQNGRLRSMNVIDVGYSAHEIYSACKRAVEDQNFRQLCRTAPNPYGQGNAGPTIADLLAKVNLGPVLLKKKMTY